MTYFRGQYHKIIRLRPEKGGILCVRIVYRQITDDIDGDTGEKTENSRDRKKKRQKNSLQAAGTGCCRCDGRAVCLTEEHYSFESESSV